MKLMLPETIPAQRITLRRLRYEDAAEIFYAYASKPEATRYVAWPTHRRIEDTYDFLHYARSGWDHGTDYSYAIRLNANNMLIGGIGAVCSDHQAQIGYIVSPTHWGKGIATEACRKLLSELTARRMVSRIETFVACENTASVKVLLKCGMIREAEMPGWFLFPNAGPERHDCLQFSFPV